MTDRALRPGAVMKKIDTADPLIEMLSSRILKQIIDRTDVFIAVGVSFRMLLECCSFVLHMDCPMPEANIKMLHEMANLIHERIIEHEECALHIAERVAEEMTGEPAPEKKTVVH